MKSCDEIFLKRTFYRFSQAFYFSDFEEKEENISMGNDLHIHWDLIGMYQTDKALIEAIRTKVLWNPPNPKKDLNLEYEDTNDIIEGEFGQPLNAEKVLKSHGLWNAKKQGFFIEAGASGGELLSNTLYFETKHNWTGLLVEPNPDWWNELKSKNRNAWVLPHCLSTQNKVELKDFYVFSKHFGDFGFWSRTEISDDLYNFFAKGDPDVIRKIKVQCFPLQAVLDALNMPKIDYFSLDIEGSEYDVLKTLDFRETNISLLGIEVFPTGGSDDPSRKNPGNKDKIHEYLKENSYSYVNSVEIDDFFVKNI